MLKVTRDQKHNVVELKLAGTINEECKLEELLGPIPQTVIFNCKEVSRINSSGILAWVKYLTQLSAKNTQVRIQECSQTLLSEFSLVANALPESLSIESVCAPYLCDSCNKDFVPVLDVEELRKSGFKAPHTPCPHCGSTETQLDDIESEYFSYFTG